MSNVASSNTPIETISSTEEKKRVLKQIEAVMDEFRGEKLSKFKAVANAIDEFDKWVGVSDMGNMLSPYLDEIHPVIRPDSDQPNDNSGTNDIASQSAQQSKGSGRKRTRGEV